MITEESGGNNEATFVNAFACDFRDFVNLSLVVCSIAIKSIKNNGLPAISMNGDG